MSLKDLKNKSPIYNWDDIQPMNLTDLTAFNSPVLNSMELSSLENFVSDLGDRRNVGITQYNPETGEFSAECDVSLLREEGELYPSFL